MDNTYDQRAHAAQNGVSWTLNAAAAYVRNEAGRDPLRAINFKAMEFQPRRRHQSCGT